MLWADMEKRLFHICPKREKDSSRQKEVNPGYSEGRDRVGRTHGESIGIRRKPNLRY